MLGLGLFVTGCNDTAKQKDKTERTVKTDQDSGQTTIKNEEEHTSTDDATGAKTETSVDEETTVKPGKDENGADLNSDTVPSETTTDGTEPAADDATATDNK